MRTCYEIFEKNQKIESEFAWCLKSTAKLALKTNTSQSTRSVLPRSARKQHGIYLCLFSKQIRFYSDSLGSACSVQSPLGCWYHCYSWIYLRYPLQHSMLPSFYLLFPTLALEWVESVFLKVVKMDLGRFGKPVLIYNTLCLSHPRGELGNSKDGHFWNIKIYKTAKLIHIRTKRCQKYVLYWKRLQIKVLEHSISYVKVSRCICLSPARRELGSYKDGYFRNIKMYKNDTVDSF